MRSMDTFARCASSTTTARIHSRIVDATLDELSAGDVVIEAAYSSVNYKDALAATGTGKILKRFPLIGGIDVSGTVALEPRPALHGGRRSARHRLRPRRRTGRRLRRRGARAGRLGGDAAGRAVAARRDGLRHGRFHGRALGRAARAQRAAAGHRPGGGDGRDGRRRQHGRRHPVGARLRGDGHHRQGRRARYLRGLGAAHVQPRDGARARVRVRSRRPRGPARWMPWVATCWRGSCAPRCRGAAWRAPA